jgi:1-acyl-sn-glycerol-3-phosphate acyltransferase
MTTWLRSLAFNLAFYIATAAFGVLGLPLLLLAPRRLVMRFGVGWHRCVLWLLKLLVGLDGEVRGRERLPPQSSACIFALKHQSTWDTLMVPVAFDDPAAVIKQELLFVPFYGWYAARAGSIFIDRKGGAGALRRMLAAARCAAAAGRPIVIFPEGTRVAPGQRLPYHAGVAALYQALSVPLVPVAVNSGLFWGRRSFVKRPGRITLEFLDPIMPGRSRREVMSELERRIEDATSRLEREAEAAVAAEATPTVAAAGYVAGAGNQSSSAVPPRIWSSE